MNKKIQTTLALFLLTTPSFAISAETTDQTATETIMYEVVVTATRSEEKVKNIPAKVEVINAQTIELTAGETITEQLKKNSSIGVIEYSGALAGIGIRGFRPEYSGITKHSLILINGRPAGATNLATILSDNIERIEVLKGPASSLYGAEAMGGVVNIITKKNHDELTGIAELGFGSFKTNVQRAAIGGGLGERFDFDLSAKRYDQIDDFRMGNGETRENTSYTTQNGSLRFGADLTKSWRLDLSGDIYQGRDIETPGDTFDGNLKSGHKDIDRYGLDFNVGGELGANNHFSFTTYKTNETAENYKHSAGWAVPVQVAPYQSYDSEIDWFGVQLKDEYSWTGHSFIFGFDYQDIDQVSRSYNQDGSRKAPYSPDESRQNIAGYLETIWKFMDERLTATAGGRYDTFEVETKATPFKTNFTPNAEDFSTFSPRIGLNYLLNQNIRLHTTLGKAFVPPTAAQLAGYAESYIGGVTMITQGNSDLDPESSITFDVGAGYDKTDWGFSFDLTYFHTDVSDKINGITVGNTQTYQNNLGAEMDGLETTISFDLGAPLEWDRTISFFVNSTYMITAEEEIASGVMRDIHNVADYTTNYGIFYDDGLIDGKLNFRSQGKMRDTDWNAAEYPETEYPSFTVVDLVTGVSFLDHHRVTLKVDNLFDKDYFEKKGFPKPGVSVYLGYSYDF